MDHEDRVRHLINKGRSTSVAWIEEDSDKTTLALFLNAMANSEGGTLIIGVDDSAQITGVGKEIEITDRVLEAALLLDPPLILPLPQSITLDEKQVIVAQVPHGMPRVYAFEGRYLCRKGTDNTPLNPRELHRLFMERGEISFEMNTPYGATLDDIDWDKAQQYTNTLKGMEDAQQALLRRGCLMKQGETLRPTNAGILLFGKDPQHFIRGAAITAVRFAGENMSDTFNRQDIIGTLPDQIRKVETFLVDHLRKGVKLQHTMARKENFEYPMEAARELVVNAVAHRDYSINGDDIRLFIFKDHMEVSSPGKLAGPITIDNIKDERFSRNPVIVQVLSDMGFIERLGYGVDRVIELMEQHGLKAPDFHETKAGFRVTLYAEQPVRKAPEKPVITEEVTEMLRDYEGTPINPRQEAALAYLAEPGNSRITNSELQRLFPDVHAETIRRDLADLVTKHILSKMGQKRGSYYVLKKNALEAEE